MGQGMMRWLGSGLLLLLGMLAPVPLLAQGGGAPLQVVVTVPELGSLVREVGGAQTAVTVLAKGTEDPHYANIRPSFVRLLHQADAFVQMGLELEIGWIPALIQQASNPQIIPGAPGFIDASIAVTPLQIPAVPVDRAQGDVHAQGNPHYLLDPVQGLLVARLLRERLTTLRPVQKAYFDERYAAFAARLGSSMVGETLARKYDVEKLALLYEHGRLQEFLQSQGEASLLGGWLGQMAPYAGTKVIADHNQWPYFAQRFRLEVLGFMEPKPGFPPTTAHLQELVQTMRAQGVRLILASAYYDPRHARFLTQHTAAKVAEMANLGESRPGTEDYLSMMDYNVRQFVTVLGKG